MTKTWTYDNLQRLTGEAVVSGQSYTDTYSYDLVGNRLSKTDVVGTGTTTTTVTTDTFNADDQLTSETGTVNSSSSWSTSFQYDLNGSLTNLTRTGAGAETDQYGYDLQKRLSSANITRTENGQGVTISATYTNDDSGYRASGSVTVNGTTTTTAYLTDTNNPTGYSQVLEEHTGSSGTLSMSYVIGLTVLGQTPASGGTSFFMPDGQGSTRQIAGPSGSISARFAFDAYGNLLYVPLGVLNPPATKILYTGQQLDPALLQYYLRARYYNPATGRFNRLDPADGKPAIPQTLHKYLYAGANPVNLIDPSGLEFSLTEFVVSNAIGVAVDALLNAVIGPFLRKIADLLIPDDVLAALRAAWPSAIRYGLSGTYENPLPYLRRSSVTAGAELLSSGRKGAFYLYAGPSFAWKGNNSVLANMGVVFNAQSSDDYDNFRLRFWVGPYDLLSDRLKGVALVAAVKFAAFLSGIAIPATLAAWGFSPDQEFVTEFTNWLNELPNATQASAGRILNLIQNVSIEIDFRLFRDPIKAIGFGGNLNLTGVKQYLTSENGGENAARGFAVLLYGQLFPQGRVFF